MNPIEYIDTTKAREVTAQEYHATIGPLRIDGYDVKFPKDEQGQTRYAIGCNMMDRRPVSWRISDAHMVEPTRYFLPAKS
jgi:hypothetical protein